MITTDLQLLSAGSIIDLYELDATNITGGSLFRWADEVNELGNDIIWQGNTYTRFPIEVNGFSRSGTGTQPRPTIRTSNVAGLIGAQVRDFADLIGAKFTRRRTFIRYLDAANFAAGNPSADPAVEMPDEIWFIDRKSAENGIFIEFELASAMDLTNARIPKRQVTQKVCAWQYRSTECGYAGAAVADIMDIPTTDIDKDVCGHRTASCKLRFGELSPLPFGGFEGSGK